MKVKSQIIRAGSLLGGSSCPEVLKNVWDKLKLHEATRPRGRRFKTRLRGDHRKVTGATAVASLRPELTSARRLGGHVLDLNEVHLRKQGDRWLIDSATPPSDFQPKRGP